MARHILTLNAGSSSIKYALFDADGAFQQPVRAGQVEGLGVGGRDHALALQEVLAEVGDAHVAAVGHRIVHGGTRFDGPALISAEVEAAIAALQPLAPLHQPHNLAGVRAARQAFAHAPQVACFDTAFHRTMPEIEQRFALPDSLFQAGVRRYGFHGLSCESICAQLAQEDAARHADSRVVIAHLGNGASMTAVRGLRSVASTMSFSPLDGLPMGTRTGRIDAAVVLHLWQQAGWDAEAIGRLLTRESGLLGLSGLSADMRTLLASEAPAARLAVAYFVHHIQRELASLAAVLQGLDMLVFTGGIGEHAVAVREAVASGAAWLLKVPGREVAVRVIATREEATIARHTAAVAGLTPA